MITTKAYAMNSSPTVKCCCNQRGYGTSIPVKFSVTIIKGLFLKNKNKYKGPFCLHFNTYELNT